MRTSECYQTLRGSSLSNQFARFPQSTRGDREIQRLSGVSEGSHPHATRGIARRGRVKTRDAARGCAGNEGSGEEEEEE